MTDRPYLIGSETFRRVSLGHGHPLAIPKVSGMIDLVRTLGWIDEDVYIDSPKATPARLRRFHDPAYVEAVMDAEVTLDAPSEVRDRYGIGGDGNPIFREIFSRPATACGATIKAVQLFADGGIVHSPSGGAHHGRPARASGFCYFNDVAIGILTMQDRGLTRICYIDIDAHHADAVEAAFADDPDVLTISIHEAGAWPFTGTESERGRSLINFAVPPGFNDSEMEFLRDDVILPLVKGHAPEVIVLQTGADSLADDPMMQLSLSNRAHVGLVKALIGVAPRFLVLGGGGYNPWSVVRCWAGIWAALNDIGEPERLPDAAAAVLRSLTQHWTAARKPPEHWLTTLADNPRPGEIREAVKQAAADVMR
jgi:acetoin utilization protein AcuC